jgi:hypothetical protein
VGCGSGYHQIPRSTNPQAHVSLLSHFSFLAIPTLSHFYVLWESHCGDQPIPCPTNPHVPCPTNHTTLRMTLLSSTSSKLHPLPFSYLVHFFECGCGTPIFSTYLFPSCSCPTTHNPTFYKMTHSLSHPHNVLFSYLVYFLIVDVGVIPFYLFHFPCLVSHIPQSCIHHIALSIPLFTLPYLTIFHLPRHHITISQSHLFPPTTSSATCVNIISLLKWRRFRKAL